MLATKCRAARYGLDGDLIDVRAGEAVPAREMVERFLLFLRPSLEEHGEWDEVSTLVRDTASRGTGAARQREVLAREGRFEGVIDFLIAETAKGVV